MRDVFRALELATLAHAGQTRKYLPEPYIGHPIRVAGLADAFGMDENAVVAAILHDVVEDTALTMEDLKPLFSARALTLVGLLTKDWADSDPEAHKRARKREYYRLIAADFDARSLKVLDRIDNLRDMVRMLALPEPPAPPGTARARWAEKYLQKSVDEVEALGIPFFLYDQWEAAKRSLRDALRGARVLAQPPV